MIDTFGKITSPVNQEFVRKSQIETRTSQSVSDEKI